MKLNHFICLFALASFFCTLSLFASGQSAWLDNFQEAKEQSKAEGKPIFALFTGSDWCEWCKDLDREVLKTKEFKDYAKDNLILFVADYPFYKEQSAELKKRNKQLQTQYKVQGYPTVFLLDSNGDILHKTGYKKGGPKNYINTELNPTVSEYLKKQKPAGAK